MKKHLLHILTTTALSLLPAIAQAQTYTPSNRTPQADNSIGTVVNPTGANSFNIDGGLQRGQNLFHSFTDFSIPTGGSANFTNPQGNQSIITRVTGNLFSDLNGTLNTNGANFLLINPNGVVFGTNARLDVGKAFVTSTASGVDFVDAQGRNYNFGVNQQGDPLLSIAPDVAFNPARLIMNASITGSKGIENYGTLQTNNQGQYIGLIGGDVTLDSGKIIAPGGRVDLAGLNSTGTVTTDSQGLVFSGNNLIRGNVVLANIGQVSAVANSQLVPVNTFLNNAATNGSSINVSANNLQIISNNTTGNQRSGLFAGLNTNSGVQILEGGNININATGKIILDGGIIRNATLEGSNGNIGKIFIDNSTNDFSASNSSRIESSIGSNAEGNSQGIDIKARTLNFNNLSGILSANRGGKGNAGNIDLNATGDITISGTDNPALLQGDRTQSLSAIMTNTLRVGVGDPGKITINTKGTLSVANRSGIFSSVSEGAEGNSQGIDITARNFNLTNLSYVQSGNYGGIGNAGDINITTGGDINISGTNDFLLQRDATTALSSITSGTFGLGNAGKITINSAGNLSLSNASGIFATIDEGSIGSSQGIEVRAENINLVNSDIKSSNDGGQGNAGNISITTKGDINIAGTNDQSLLQGDQIQGIGGILSNTFGQGNAGKIIIDAAGNLSVTNRGSISSGVSKVAEGSSQGIDIKAANLNLKIFSYIRSNNSGGKGDAGDIFINVKGSVDVDEAAILSGNIGQGKAADISINGYQFLLNNALISSKANSVSGGNIKLSMSDKLLMRNDSLIATDSGSVDRNGNGGNIAIYSPLIIATPGNNDITANAYQGNGGRVNITSQGLFGIQYRPVGATFTNDITASSTFGLSGNVQINTPGIDPGKDTGELPAAPNDASNQISQACGASQRENKFYITGRGGLPPNASEPQESEALWQDARATKPKPATTATQPGQLAPPAIGWVFQPDGRVRLIAAQTGGGATGTKAVCPGK